MPTNDNNIETALSPDEFLARVREATVPYEEIINVRAPVTGYKSFLEHSFSGSKQVMARIEGKAFMLMPIGIWPVKGPSPLANAGALHGTVEANKSGSRVTTRYRFALGSLLFVAVFSVVSFGMVVIAAVATAMTPRPNGILLIQGLAVASCLFTAVYGSYLWIGGRTQSRQLRAFLADFQLKTHGHP